MFALVLLKQNIFGIQETNKKKSMGSMVENFQLQTTLRQMSEKIVHLHEIKKANNGAMGHCH